MNEGRKTIRVPSVVPRLLGAMCRLSSEHRPRSFRRASSEKILRDLGAPFHPLPTVIRASGMTASFRLARTRRFALRLPASCDARCVRPTSASQHIHYEHPRLVGSRSLMAYALVSSGNTAFHDAAIRFGGSCGSSVAGRSLPRDGPPDRASGIPVASHVRPAALSHAPSFVKTPRSLRPRSS